MLELRVSADAKRVASMREAICRECERTQTGYPHAAAVAFVAEQLVVGDAGAVAPRRFERSPEMLVIVNVQSDATMLMVRESRVETNELGDRRQRVLDECTSRWSTMTGRDGRTVWAEIARPDPPADKPTVVAEPLPTTPVLT